MSPALVEQPTTIVKGKLPDDSSPDVAAIPSIRTADPQHGQLIDARALEQVLAAWEAQCMEMHEKLMGQILQVRSLSEQLQDESYSTRDVVQLSAPTTRILSPITLASAGDLDAIADEGSPRQGSGEPASPKLNRRSTIGYQYVTDKKQLAHGPKAGGAAINRAITWWTHLEEPERTSWLAQIVRSRGFSFFTQMLILLTTAYTIMVADHQAKTFERDLGTVEFIGLALSLMYIGEVGLRIIVHRFFFFTNEDAGWNIFDFLLAACEIWSLFSDLVEKSAGLKVTFMRSLRVLRITRLLRVFKLVSALKVLRLLLEAMLGSLTTVMWCGVVILFTLLISALMFVQLVADFMIDSGCGRDACTSTDTLLQSFGSVPQAMLTLFMATSGGQDWIVYYDDLQLVGWGAASAFVAFTFFFQFGMFNLLTSMFVDRAMKASKPDIDMMILDQRTRECEDAVRLKKQFKQFDKDNDGSLSMVEFAEMLRDSAMSSFLAAAGLEIRDAEMFFASLSEVSGNDSVPIEAFVQGCMRMKGNATSIDMQALSFEVRLMNDKLNGLKENVDQLKSPVSKVMWGSGSASSVSRNEVAVATECVNGCSVVNLQL